MCTAALATLVQKIVNNQLPASVRTLLTTSLLVSLEKGNGGAGRRPVAIGDMFYRMATRFALSRIHDQARTVLSPHQFGVGQEDGCAQIVQSVQHLLRQIGWSSKLPMRL